MESGTCLCILGVETDAGCNAAGIDESSVGVPSFLCGATFVCGGGAALVCRSGNSGI